MLHSLRAINELYSPSLQRPFKGIYISHLFIWPRVGACCRFCIGAPFNLFSRSVGQSVGRNVSAVFFERHVFFAEHQSQIFSQGFLRISPASGLGAQLGLEGRGSDSPLVHGAEQTVPGITVTVEVTPSRPGSETACTVTCVC